MEGLKNLCRPIENNEKLPPRVKSVPIKKIGEREQEAALEYSP